MVTDETIKNLGENGVAKEQERNEQYKLEYESKNWFYFNFQRDNNCPFR